MLLIILLIIILVVCTQTFIISCLLPQKNKIDITVIYFICFMFFDAGTMLVFTQLLEGTEYVSTAAPFGLLYGPLLYIVYIKAQGKKIKSNILLVHFSPFILGTVFYIIYLCSPIFQKSYAFHYYIILYSMMSIEWIVYPLIIMTSRKRILLLQLGVFKYSMSTLLVLTSFMIPFVWYNYSKGILNTEWWTGTVLVCSMLISVVLAYGYVLERLIRSHKADSKLIDVERTSVVKEDLMISESTDKYLNDDFDKINIYLSKEKYLDSTFNWEQMISDLKIPRSTVSEYFTYNYSSSFLKIINQLRIEKACSYLEEVDLSYTMDEISYLCGFNSRASFYRNFNAIKDTSPLKYRELFLQNLPPSE